MSNCRGGDRKNEEVFYLTEQSKPLVNWTDGDQDARLLAELRVLLFTQEHSRVAWRGWGQFIPVATTVTNLEPKCPSGERRQMLGCWFWK